MSVPRRPHRVMLSFKLTALFSRTFRNFTPPPLMSGKKGFTCKDLFPWMSNQTSTNMGKLVCKILSTGVQAPHAMCQFPSWTKGPFILYIQLDGTCPNLNSVYKHGNVQWEKSSHLNALERTSISTCFNTPFCKSKRT